MATEATQRLENNDRSKMIHIEHGANDIDLPVAGFSVCKVQQAVAETLNVPPHAAAFVNGNRVRPDHILVPGDQLEFLQECGRKGVGQVWTKDQFMLLFSMKEVNWQEWVKRGLPFDTMDDGTIVLNETEVDEIGRASCRERV